MEVPAFYQMSSFIPISMRRIEKEKPPFSVLDLCKSARYSRQINSYFETATFERVGILEGEYALICDCNLLLSRNGTLTRAASAWEDGFGSRNIAEVCTSDVFHNGIDNVLSLWDVSPIIESPAILSGMLLKNYFHFSLETVPRIRLAPAAALDKVVVAESALQLPFQTSLLSRAGAGCNFVPAPPILRVRNPIVSHDVMSEDGVRWLRQFGLRAGRGDRRLYIRRGSQSARLRPGGNLEETPEFLDLLKELKFEIIEFGSGNTIDVQVSLLEGAGLILSAHGAALTNIAYLEAGTSVLEVIGAATPIALYMHLSGMLNLNYCAILTDSYTEGGNMLLDTATLRDCILSMI